MQPFESIRGLAVVLPQPNIDTDAIIRIERLMMVPRAELGRYAFEMLRWYPDGSPRQDCWLNQPAFSTASIVIGGPNFGCGSSRETAVWAMQGYGIRCVISTSFGDIFRVNCIKNGVLPVVLGQAEYDCVRADWSELGGDHATYQVDLRAQRIVTPQGHTLAFSSDPSEREQLLLGVDEIVDTKRFESDITRHLDRWKAQHPWLSSLHK